MPLLLTLTLVAIAAAYLLAPWRINLLLLGIDRAPPGTVLGRSDTILLMSAQPLTARVAMLSVPRDLWVTIPGRGENRINAAHFLAESEAPGTGPQAALETVQANFGIPVRYYLRLQFDGLRRLVDALGGVEVVLPEGMAGYPAGVVILDGNQALAFVRDRAGSDDFDRMARSQLFFNALLAQAARPQAWPRLPAAALELMRTLDSDLPLWEWPRLVLTLLRSGSEGIDARVLPREAVRPFITSSGASVLLPDWDGIWPLVAELFGD